jgi:hypothetical protein
MSEAQELGSDHHHDLYSTGYWREWKKGCSVQSVRLAKEAAAEEEGAQEEAKLKEEKEITKRAEKETQEGDWLCEGALPALDIVLKARGEEVAAKADKKKNRGKSSKSNEFTSMINSKFKTLEIHDFGEPQGREAKKLRPPSPPQQFTPYVQLEASHGKQAASTNPTRPQYQFSRSGGNEYQRMYLGADHQRKIIPNNPQTGPGTYKTPTGSVAQQVLSENRSMPKYSFPNKQRKNVDEKTISPGMVYTPLLEGTKPDVQTHKFGQQKRVTVNVPVGASPGPKYQTRTKPECAGGTTFAGPWTKARAPKPKERGLRARGCIGFGYDSSLREFIKYGHSLDGNDSQRASWERSVNLAASKHKKEEWISRSRERDACVRDGKVFKEEKDGAMAHLEKLLQDTSSSLHYACEYAEADTSQMLLNRGSDMNSLDARKRTPMHIACTKGSLHIVMIMLNAPTWLEELHLQRAPCNLDLQDSEGRTCLHRASMGGFHYIVEKLLLAGADATLLDQDGRTASFYAGTQLTYQFLQEADKQRRQSRRDSVERGKRKVLANKAAIAAASAAKSGFGAGAGPKKPKTAAQKKAAFRQQTASKAASPYT